MTTDERKALRLYLTALGFARVRYTDDLTAVGNYQEWWRNGENVVTISWGPRDKAPAQK